MSSELPVRCPGCGRGFKVPASQKGGLANCPGCKALVGIPDPGGVAALRTSVVLCAVAVAGVAAWAGVASGSIAVGVGVGVVLGGLVAAVFAAL